MAELFDGVKVRIGRQDFIVPALSIRQVKRFRPVLSTMGRFAAGGEPSDQELDALTEMLHAALSRNYPDLTVDQLGDMIDLRSLPELIKAIVARTELEATKPGEAGEGVPSTGTP